MFSFTEWAKKIHSHSIEISHGAIGNAHLQYTFAESTDHQKCQRPNRRCASKYLTMWGPAVM